MKKYFGLMLLMVGIVLGVSNLRADSVEEEYDEGAYLLENISTCVETGSYCIKIDLDEDYDPEDVVFTASVEDSVLSITLKDSGEIFASNRGDIEVKVRLEGSVLYKVTLPAGVDFEKMKIEHKGKFLLVSFPFDKNFQLPQQEEIIKEEKVNNEGLELIVREISNHQEGDSFIAKVDLEHSAGRGLIYLIDDDKEENAKDIKILDVISKDEICSFKAPVLEGRTEEYIVDTEREGDKLYFYFSKNSSENSSHLKNPT